MYIYLNNKELAETFTNGHSNLMTGEKEFKIKK